MEIALLESQVWKGWEVVMLLWGAQDAVRNVVVVVVDITAPRAVEIHEPGLVGSGGWRNVLSRVGMSSDMSGLDGAAELGGEGRGHGEAIEEPCLRLHEDATSSPGFAASRLQSVFCFECVPGCYRDIAVNHLVLGSFNSWVLPGGERMGDDSNQPHEDVVTSNAYLIL